MRETHLMAWRSYRFRRRLRGARRLDRALSDLRGETAVEHRRPLYEALLRADLAVMTATDPGTPAWKEAHGEVQIKGTVDAEGKLVLAAFTNPAAMRAWNAELAGVVAIPAKNLFTYFRTCEAETLLVNPGTDAAAELSRVEVSALAEGKIPSRGDHDFLEFEMRSGTAIDIGRPNYGALPTGFVPTLRVTCAKVSDVEKAYVFELDVPGEESRQVVGLRLNEHGDPERVVRDVGDELSRKVEGVEFVEFHFLDSDFEEAVRQVTSAVFER